MKIPQEDRSLPRGMGVPARDRRRGSVGPKLDIPQSWDSLDAAGPMTGTAVGMRTSEVGMRPDTADSRWAAPACATRV